MVVSPLVDANPTEEPAQELLHQDDTSSSSHQGQPDQRREDSDEESLEPQAVSLRDMKQAVYNILPEEMLPE